MTKLEFEQLYADELLKQVQEHPQLYGYGSELVPTVAHKMVNAVINGTYNLDSPALRHVMSKLKVKYTRAAIREWVQNSLTD